MIREKRGIHQKQEYPFICRISFVELCSYGIFCVCFASVPTFLQECQKIKKMTHEI